MIQQWLFTSGISFFTAKFSLHILLHVSIAVSLLLLAFPLRQSIILVFLMPFPQTPLEYYNAYLECGKWVKTLVRAAHVAFCSYTYRKWNSSPHYQSVYTVDWGNPLSSCSASICPRPLTTKCIYSSEGAFSMDYEMMLILIQIYQISLLSLSVLKCITRFMNTFHRKVVKRIAIDYTGRL